MEAIEAKIVEQKFLDCNFSFPRKLLENVNVNLATKANIRLPQDAENKSVLLNTVVEITNPDEEVNVLVDVDTIFELNKIPDNYEQLAEKKLLPMALVSLFHKMDNLLEIMGHNKMRLAEQLQIGQDI